ncbi:hypothetical protein SIN8267_03187 [Sinobacterium norvegicum]|uniref:LTXXQ motif family protein n=1 Tax=Sinobacterium norvegicum TaxID=1641715 RepID=A0ABN8EKX5_9GAMM|nr:hypothetical protein [Sinobacterium norvegicum]CAH0993048.1 hypothetical protein SIN8267_03187 [Sinobacterium norvegicum]
MRNIILATVVSAVLIAPIAAMAGPDHHQIKSDFISSLNLTEQQQAQVKELQKEARQERKATMEQHRLQQRQELAKILNEDQLASWDKQMEKREKHHKGRDGDRQKRGDFFQSLNLTEQQQGELKTLMQNNKEQMKSFRQAKQGEKRAKMATILSADQMQQYDQFVADKKQRHSDKGHGERH